MLQFFRDLALIPHMWRHLVHYGRQSRDIAQQTPEIRGRREARVRERRAALRTEIIERGWWDPAWGPTPAGAKELIRNSSF